MKQRPQLTLCPLSLLLLAACAQDAPTSETLDATATADEMVAQCEIVDIRSPAYRYWDSDVIAPIYDVVDGDHEGVDPLKDPLTVRAFAVGQRRATATLSRKGTDIQVRLGEMVWSTSFGDRIEMGNHDDVTRAPEFRIPIDAHQTYVVRYWRKYDAASLLINDEPVGMLSCLPPHEEPREIDPNQFSCHVGDRHGGYGTHDAALITRNFDHDNGWSQILDEATTRITFDMNATPWQAQFGPLEMKEGVNISEHYGAPERSFVEDEEAFQWVVGVRGRNFRLRVLKDSRLGTIDALSWYSGSLRSAIIDCRGQDQGRLFQPLDPG